MPRQKLLAQMFARIDALDPAFTDGFTDDGVFRMGNLDAVHGKKAIKEFAGGFFGAIGGIRHQIDDTCIVADRVFANGSVTYTRKDGSALTVPFATIGRFDGEKLAEHTTYVDASKLFAP